MKKDFYKSYTNPHNHPSQREDKAEAKGRAHGQNPCARMLFIK